MKKYLAEAIGTMVLVLMGCGVAVSLGCTSNEPALASTVVGTALAFGLAVVAMAYTIGGAAVLYLCTSTSGDVIVGTGANACQPGVDLVGGRVAEIVFTMILRKISVCVHNLPQHLLCLVIA